MSWNYRIVRDHKSGGLPELTEPVYGIHEVYYDDGEITAWSSEPIAPCGETQDELRQDLDAMARAFDGPVVDVSTGKALEEAGG